MNDDLTKYREYISGYQKLFGTVPCDYEQGYEDGYFEKPLREWEPGSILLGYFEKYEAGWEDGYADRQREKDGDRATDSL